MNCNTTHYRANSSSVPGDPTPVWTYTLGLAVAAGTPSGLTIGGAAINLYNVGGTIVGSTAASAPASATAASVVFSVGVSNTGVVTLSQLQQVDHPKPGSDTQISLANNLVNLTGTATITDTDGDVATNSKTIDLGGNIRFDDATPTANADSGTQTNEGAPFTIDALANDVFGADGVNTADALKVVVSTQAANGTVTYNPGNGLFTYTPAVNSTATSDSFQYTITDRDGDTSTATVTLTLSPDSVPLVVDVTAAVDDDGLSGTNGIGNPANGGNDILATTGSAPASTSEAVFNGKIVVNFGGDTGTVSFANLHGTSGLVGTETVNYTWDGPNSTLRADSPTRGTLVFTVKLMPNGDYTVSLFDNVLHAPGGNDETSAPAVALNYRATDSDGDVVETGKLSITFNDDTPTANADGTTQGLENQQVSINVLTNDVAGADGVAPSSVALVAGSQVGGGTLSHNGSGTFTLTPTPGQTGTVSFQYTITDGDGDVSTATATITLLDDSVPQVVDVVASVDDDGLTGGNPLSTAGDIAAGTAGEATYAGQITVGFGGDTGTVSFANLQGATGSVGADTVSYAWAGATLTATITTGGARSGLTLFTVDLTPSGAYTVTLVNPVMHAAGGNEASAPVVDLNYRASDSDGDTSETGKLSITFNDDMPSVTLIGEGTPTLTVDDSTLATNAGPVSFAGVFSSAFGADGAGASGSKVYTLGISASGALTGLIDTATGQPVVLNLIDSSYVEGQAGYGGPAVFTLSLDAAGNVTLDQIRAVKQPNTISSDESVSLSAANLITLTLTTTDADGDTATATAEIGQSLVFKDDGPLALDDANGVAEGLGNSTSGNVYGPAGASLGDQADTIGADGGAVTAARAGTEGAGGLLQTVNPGTTVTGTYGNLVINPDGTYSYTLTAAAVPNGASDTFTYRITDGDGDNDFAQLVIAISQNTQFPVVGSVTATVHEDGLADGAQYGPNSETMTGSFTINANGEGYTLTLDGDGSPVVITAALQTVVTSKGVLTITAIDPPAGNLVTYHYSYTLSGPLTHAGQGEGTALTDTISITVLDATGDSTAGSLVVSIIDDLPVVNVVDTPSTVVEGGMLIGSWSYAYGADSAGAVTKVVFGGNEYELGAVIDTGNGSLVVSAGGTWQFNAHNNLIQSASDPTATFTIKVTDGDGDIATDTQIISITDGTNPSAVQDGGAIVEESDLGTVNAIGSTSTGNDETSSGTVLFKAGSDSITGIVFGPATGLPVQLNGVGGNDIVWTRVNDTQIVGEIGGIVAITINLGLPTLPVGPSQYASATITATLSDNFPHPAGGMYNQLSLTGLQVVATDIDGDTAAANVTIVVTDDVPTIDVTAAANNVVEGGTVGGGYALTVGADGVGSLTITAGAQTTTLLLDNSANTTSIVTPQGTLTVNANGTWSFAAATNQTDGASLSFTISGTDGDGDPFTDSQTIAITDGAGPSVSGSVAVTVAEAALDTTKDPLDIAAGVATGSTPGLFTETQQSTGLTFTAGSDAIATIRFADPATPGNVPAFNAGLNAGTVVTWTLSVDGHTLTGKIGGIDAIVLQLTGGTTASAGGTVTPTVTVTLTDNFPHEDSPNAADLTISNIKVIAAEADGESVAGNVTVTVSDDGPTITVSATNEAGITLTTQDADTIGSNTDTATSSANFGSVFSASSTPGADGAGAPVWTYTLGLAVAAGTPSGLTIGGAAINLYNVGGTIVGSTAASAPASATAASVVFSVAVSNTGVVTLSQLQQIDHNPASSTQVSLNTGLVNLTGSATITDGDSDTATDSKTIDLGGNIRFDDAVPTITVSTTNEAGVTLTTQDADTIGAATDTATSSANFGSVFTQSSTPGADGAGAPVWTYTLGLAVAAGTNSGLTIGGAAINLYNVGGTIVGATSAPATATDASVVFSVAVSNSGVVTLSQLQQVDHNPASSTQVSLANGLVNLTGTATITDTDGDVATDSKTIDLGGNIRFDDATPTLTVNVGTEANVTMTTQDAETIGAATDTAVSTANFGGLFSLTSNAGADAIGATTPSLGYALSLAVTAGTNSGLTIGGTAIKLYSVGGVIVGSTALSAPGTATDASVVFSIGVNGTGVVTLSQLQQVDHPKPGSDTQISLANGLVNLTASATITDGDGDAATDSKTIDLGGNIRFDDATPTAVLDTGLTVAENAAATAGVNLLANDVQGADGATLTSVTFGAVTTAIAASGTTIVTPASGQGTYTFQADGSWTFDPNVNASTSNQDGSFSYTITDKDGDTSTATQTVTITNVETPLLLIGSGDGDAAGTPTDHTIPNPNGSVDGVLNGSSLDDKIVGDPGAVTIVPGQTANIVLVLDSSGSMTTSISFDGGSVQRIEALKTGVKALIDSLSESGAQAIRVTIIDFDTGAVNRGTFNLIAGGAVNAAQVTAAKAAVDLLDADGNTNYEAALQAAHSWITGNSGNNDIANANINKVVFVSDGEPQAYVSNSGVNATTDASRAMAELLGTYDTTGSSSDDNVNDVAAILNAISSPYNYTIDSIGINVGSTALGYLSDVEDGNASGGTGSAQNVTTAEQLAGALSVLGASTALAAAGNDTINGGDGADIIFGDVLYTDALATQTGTGTAAGSGFAVFQTLENRSNLEVINPDGLGTNDWNRADTLAYIQANHLALSQESGRAGGNDTINGGDGNDTIYGQEGNDTIHGDAGNDTISGGTGADLLFGDAGDDTFLFNTGDVVAGETINGGADTDTIKVVTSTSFANLNGGTTALRTTNLIERILITSGQAATFTGAQLTAQAIAINATAVAAATLNINVTGTGDFSQLTFAAFGGNDAFNTGVDLVNITGSGGVDTITGTSLADSIVGGAGNDTIIGAQNDTLLDGGADFDILSVGANFTSTSDAQIANFENITLTTGVMLNLANQTENLVITGSSGNDTITGGSGADSIIGNAGADSISGGAGDDTIYGADNDLLLDGGANNDTLVLSANFTSASDAQVINIENVTITTGVTVNLSNQTEAFNIAASSDSTIVVGGSGSDTITNSGQNGNLTGGLGIDTFNITAGLSVITDLGAGGLADVLKVSASTSAIATATGAWTATAATTNAGFASINANGNAVNLALAGGASGWTITNSGAGAALTGSANADTITGGTGADTITGGAGVDVLSGGDGNDTFNLANNDFTGAESINGGNDTDTIVLTGAQTVNFSTGTISNVENLTGSSGNDLVTISVAQFGAFSAIDLAGGTNTLTVNIANTTTDLSGFSPTSLSNIATASLIGTGSGDTVTVSAQQYAAFNTIDLGGGTDTLNVKVSGTVDISTASATTLTSINNTSITGTSGADNIKLTITQFNALVTGSGTANLGTGGADTSDNLFLVGSGSNDSLTVTLSGSAITNIAGEAVTGIDTFQVDLGGGTSDTLNYGASSSAVTVNLSTGAASGFTAIAGVENVIGGSGADTLTGDSNANILAGGGGADTYNLTAGGTDTIRFEATAAANGIDIITGFSAGSGGDVLNFNLAGITAGIEAANPTTFNGAITAYVHNDSGENDDNDSLSDRVAIVATGGSFTVADDETQIAAMFNGNNVDPFSLTNNQNGVLLTGSAGSNTVFVWFVENNNNGTILNTEVRHVATITLAVGQDINSFHVDNFSFNAIPPIVIDLDGDGAEFLSLTHGVTFDYAADGKADGTAWAGADDGILSIDLNGDGAITSAGEFVFGGNGLTDLQGLALKYDSNHDGVLDALDASFAKFGVWQDANSNGVSEAGEFKSLADMGIVSVKLTSDGVSYDAANGDVIVHGTTTYTKADGTTGSAADASFATDADRQARTADIAAVAAAASGVIAASIVAASDAPEAQAAPAAAEDAGAAPAAGIAQDAPASAEAHGDAAALLGSAPAEAGAAQPAGAHQGDAGDASATSLTAPADHAPAPAAEAPAEASPAHASAFDFGGNDGHLMDALLAANIAAPAQAPAANSAPADAQVAVLDALGDTVAAQTVDAVIDHFAGAEATAAPAPVSDPAALQSLLLASVGPAADHALPAPMPHIVDDHAAALAAA